MTTTAVPHQTGLARSTATVTRRALLRYARTPQLIVLATLQMALFFLIYRYMFGGAIHVAGIDDYVDFLVPGFVATGVLFTGIGTATAMADDLNDGFVDRLRSLPIPMVDAVRSLTLGPEAHVVLGHPTSYFVTRALLWTVAIVAVFLPVAVAKYRRG